MRRFSAVPICLSFAAAVFSVSCAPQEAEEQAPGTDVQAVRAAIEQVNQQFVEAFKAGDVATMASLYAEDAVVLAPGEEMVHGRAAIQESMAAQLPPGVQEFSLATMHVGAEGSLAYEVGTYSLTFQPEGQPSVSDAGKYVVVWERQADGSWKLKADIWNSNAPPMPPEE